MVMGNRGRQATQLKPNRVGGGAMSMVVAFVNSL
jgi:hypothetical protein